MLKRVFLFAAALLSFVAHADEEEPESYDYYDSSNPVLKDQLAAETLYYNRVLSSAVKVYSQKCRGRGPVLEGSGLLFKHERKAYILTSDHVVLHGNAPFCHRIFNSKFGENRAEYVISDWGYGLALLRAPDLDSKTQEIAFDYEDGGIRGSTPLLSQILSTGYPSGSRVPMVGYEQNSFYSSGEFALSNPYFHPLAKVRVARTTAEFGMSGGVSFVGGALAGILSYKQVLNPREILTYAITGATAQKWLLSYFLKHRREAFFETPEAQLNRTGEVCTDGLKFTPVCSGLKRCTVSITLLGAGQCGQGISTYDTAQIHKWIEELERPGAPQAISVKGYDSVGHHIRALDQ